MTVQPTEQWVQMLFLRVISTPGVVGPASALPTMLMEETAPAAANPPAASPERFRKARRSIGAAAATEPNIPVPRPAAVGFLLTSMANRSR
ncbi:hypothetical protein SAE02_51230 [Skermanella aerolata]|uniref:Uncharacterized protein n=1 Tax=Skermanella aerolata TaxID=393310 RepID=A0A512DWW6_9PROT|nr:hypothetical protein SAE02_51230 [Skermanella aerolata]